jgi:SAM-dependent methyltransferase
MTSLFDQYADNYNEGHARAVKGTGYEPSYFHEYKVREVATYMKSRGLADKQTTFLNVGCGIGESEPYIKKYLPKARVYGIDVSEKCVEVAREVNKHLPDVAFAAYDGETIPFGFNFDVIFVANVFHHIRHENHVAMLTNLHRRLNDNGVIFLFELNPLNPLTLWIAYKNDYKFDKDSKLLNPYYTRKILSESGFKERKVRYTIFFPNYLSFLLPFEKYLRRLPFGAHYYYVAKK